MSKYNVIAIDLAKNVFQVCKTDHLGKIIFNKAVKRNELKNMLIREKKSLVAMESCGSTHYWARFAKAQGHNVKAMSARVVKGFLQGQKTDANDAVAISIAALQPNVKSCRLISVETQSLQCMDKSRLLLQKSKRAIANQIRAQLLEFGFAIAKSDKKLNEAVLMILGDAENELTGHFRFSLHTMWQCFLEITGNLDETIKRCTQATNEDEACLRLQRLEGVGPIGAMGLRVALSDIEHFKSGREASACLGATPVQHSSGGKVNIGSISKTSAHKNLRAVLYQGAFSVVNKVKIREAKTEKEVWIKALLARKPLKVVTVALINKTIRTAYAILKNKTEYNATLLAGNIA